MWPLATPRKTWISREVRFTRPGADSGVASAIRRSTSGIILRGTGLSLRRAANNARWSSAGPTSFRTYPEQPACIILSRSSLDSDTVHATILVPGCLARSSLAVEGPSMDGMWTSINTRSGLNRSAALSASSPDEASPANLMSGIDPSMARAAVRGTMLSSTTITRYFR